MSISETQGEPLRGDEGVLPGRGSVSIPLASAMVASLIVAVTAATVAWVAANGLRIEEVVNMNKDFGGATLSVPRATRNGAIAYASLGAILASGLAVTGLFAARRLTPARLFVGIVIGAALGALLPTLSCQPLFPWYFANLEQTDLRVALLTHLGIWASVGAAAGASFGVGVGRRDILVRAAVGGIIGAAVATLLFDIIGLFFPFAHTERPLAEDATTRLAANFTLAIFAAIGTLVVALQEGRDSKTNPTKESA